MKHVLSILLSVFLLLVGTPIEAQSAQEESSSVTIPAELSPEAIRDIVSKLDPEKKEAPKRGDER